MPEYIIYQDKTSCDKIDLSSIDLLHSCTEAEINYTIIIRFEMHDLLV